MAQAVKKIAILGGGLGSLSTAFALTNESNWKERYEITIYQTGWRLGGKCASGRNLDPDYQYRIEEHGFHVWMGFYDNAFAMIIRAYKELARKTGPFQLTGERHQANTVRSAREFVKGLPGISARTNRARLLVRRCLTIP